MASRIPNAHVTERASNQRKGVYFWRLGAIGCGTHRTQFTPHWCSMHELAHDGEPGDCPVCEADGFTAGMAEGDRR